jgi:hypothetical protein
MVERMELSLDKSRQKILFFSVRHIHSPTLSLLTCAHTPTPARVPYFSLVISRCMMSRPAAAASSSSLASASVRGAKRKEHHSPSSAASADTHPTEKNPLLVAIWHRINMWLEDGCRVMRREGSSDASKTEGEEEEEEEDTCDDCDAPFDDDGMCACGEDDDDDDANQQLDGHNVTVVIAGRGKTKQGMQDLAHLFSGLDLDDDDVGFGPSETKDGEKKTTAVVKGWSTEEQKLGYPFVLMISFGREGVSGGVMYDNGMLSDTEALRDWSDVWMPLCGQACPPKGSGCDAYRVHFDGQSWETSAVEEDVLAEVLGDKSVLFSTDTDAEILRIGVYYDDETTLSMGSSPYHSQEGATRLKTVDPDGRTSDEDRRILARGYEFICPADVHASAAAAAAERENVTEEAPAAKSARVE